MSDAVKRIIFDDTAAIESLQRMKQELQGVSDAARGSMEDANGSLESFGKEIGDTSEKVDKQFNKSLGESSKVISKSKVSLDDYNKTLESSAKELGLMDNVLGRTVVGLTSKIKSLRGVVTGLKAASLGAKAFRVALISTGIGAIVVALGSLVAFLTTTQKGMDAVSKATRVVGTVFSVIVERIAKFGEALSKLFRGDIKGAAETAKEAISGIGDAIVNAASAAADLADRELQLRRDKIDFIVRESELDKEISEQRAKMLDESLTLVERQEALNRAKEAEEEKTLTLIELKQQEIDILAEGQEITENLLSDNEELANLIAERNKLQEQSNNQQRSFARDQIRLNNEARRRAKERQKEIEDQQKAFADLVGSLEQEIQKLDLAQLSGIDRITAEAQLAVLEVDKLEKKLIDAAQAAGKEFTEFDKIERLREAIEQERLKRIDEITKAEEQAQRQRQQAALDTNLRILEAAKQLAIREGEATKERIDKEEELQRLQVQLLKESGDEQISLEEFKNRELLRIQREGLEQRLQFAEGIDAEIIRTQIDIINDQINQIGQQQSETLNPFGYLKEQIKEALQIDDEELAEIINVAGIASDAISALITESTDRALEENERLLQSFRDRSNSLEDELKRELKLQEYGLANNVALKEQELRELNRLEAEAERERADLEAKQLRRQRNQELAQQGIAITTAIANTLSQASRFGPILAPIIAAAGIVSILSTFRKYRSQAQSEVRAYKGGSLAEYTGGQIKPGASSDIPGRGKGLRIEGTNMKVGGNEYIVAEKGVNKENIAMLDHINKGLSYKSFKGFQAVHKELNRQNESIDRHRSSIINYYQGSGGVTSEAIEKAVMKGIEAYKRYDKEERESVQYIDDYKIVTKGKNTKKIKIK